MGIGRKQGNDLGLLQAYVCTVCTMNIVHTIGTFIQQYVVMLGKAKLREPSNPKLVK